MSRLLDPRNYVPNGHNYSPEEAARIGVERGSIDPHSREWCRIFKENGWNFNGARESRPVIPLASEQPEQSPRWNQQEAKKLLEQQRKSDRRFAESTGAAHRRGSAYIPPTREPREPEPVEQPVPIEQPIPVTVEHAPSLAERLFGAKVKR